MIDTMERELTIDYSPLSFQKRFHESTKPNVYLSGGYGCGKTYSLCMKLLQLANENKGLAGGLVCPTLKMFKRDVLPTLKEICMDNDILYHYHKTDYYFYFPDIEATVYVFHAEDDGQSIRGPNLAFMCINEVTLISEDAYLAAIARVRDKRASFKQIAMSGTPEQFNWAYEYFMFEPRQDTDLIYGETRKNVFVSDDYVSMLERSYDENMLKQYVEGIPVNLTGKRAVYAFDRRKHTSSAIQQIRNAPVWVSLDFNVDPMSAVLWNPLPPTSQYELQAFDEIKLNSSNTFEMADILKRKLAGRLDSVVIYPDPAGKARSTKTKGISDIEIVKEAGFKDIKMKPAIYSVRDCLNAVNNLFDKNKILISEQCKNLIADLEQCKLKDNFEIDKKDPKRSHWLDGMKNMIDYEYPIRTGMKARSFQVR